MHAGLDPRLVTRMPDPGRVGDETPRLGVLQPLAGQPRIDRVALATTGLMLSGFCARPRYVAEVMRMGLLAGVMAGPVPGLFT